VGQAPAWDAPGTLLPYVAAIRRMLWARFCRPILALARTMPIIRTIRPPGEVSAEHVLDTSPNFALLAVRILLRLR
jgi:hypothetical protein